MYLFFKPILFLFSPEKAHQITMWLLDLAAAFPPTNWLLRKIFTVEDPSLAVEAMGLRFPNPVGLAAGFDKDGKHIEGLACLGFGFIEVGTVTPLPQDGNPKPRLFRLPADEALINRMGFNNEGLDALVGRLRRMREKAAPGEIIIGGNIGKNKATPNENAVDDYLKCFAALHPYVDYFVVNVSSPNTPNLRELQEKEPLNKILSALSRKNNEMTKPRPILLKIAPDLTEGQLDDITEIVRGNKLAGVVATNTTISREKLRTPKPEIDKIGAGGLSGQPLRERSMGVVRFLREKIGMEIAIVGVGGINSGLSGRKMQESGATLLQVYSGLIYEGPSIVKNILKNFRKV